MSKPIAGYRKRGRWLANFRARHLSVNPLCVHCMAKGRPIAATQVDHIVALANGGKDFDEDPDNAQGLCEDCHKAKTAEDLGHRQKVAIGLDGWPVDE